MDKIEDRLGLGEIELAVKKSAPRELPRLGGTGASVQNGAQYAPRRDETAVALNFDGVLSGVAVRRAHYQEKHFVEGLIGRNDASVNKGAGRSPGGRLSAAVECAIGNLKRPGPADTYDRQPPDSRRGCNGGDRIGNGGVRFHETSSDANTRFKMPPTAAAVKSPEATPTADAAGGLKAGETACARGEGKEDGPAHRND